MSDQQTHRGKEYPQYDALSVEELEAILRLDAEMPEGQESDTEKILYIMEVLAKKKKKNGHTGKTALEAYESFKENYMPETDNRSTVTKPVHRSPGRLRGAAAAAAVLVLLIGGTVTAKAFGFDLWKAVVQWTQETFHFGDWGNSGEENNREYASFQEALEQGNVPAWLVPTLLSEEFEMTELKVEQTPAKKKYTAIYENGMTSLRITIQDHLDEPFYVEQSNGFAEEYTFSGVTYYLFENNKRRQAVWVVDSYECRITGELTVDMLKEMIKSIEKG